MSELHSAHFDCKNEQLLGSGVAQLAERSLPTPDVCGSNPVIGKFKKTIDLINWKDKNNPKRGREFDILLC